MNAESYTVEGKPNELVSLSIAAGPATGYAWTLELPEGVEQMGEGQERAVNPAYRLGAAVAGNLQVRASKPGDYAIVARLARPWNRTEVVRTVRIALQIRD